MSSKYNSVPSAILALLYTNGKGNKLFQRNNGCNGAIQYFIDFIYLFWWYEIDIRNNNANFYCKYSKHHIDLILIFNLMLTLNFFYFRVVSIWKICQTFLTHNAEHGEKSWFTINVQTMWLMQLHRGQKRSACHYV